MKDKLMYYPREGYKLTWDERGLAVTAIDYQAETLNLTWPHVKDILREAGELHDTNSGAERQGRSLPSCDQSDVTLEVAKHHAPRSAKAKDAPLAVELTIAIKGSAGSEAKSRKLRKALDQLSKCQFSLRVVDTEP